MMGGGMMGGGFGPGFGAFGLGGLIGMFFNIAILVGIVLLVVWAVQRFTRSNSAVGTALPLGGPTPGQPLSAREILDTRYARGELTREQYQAMLSDIS